MAIAQNVFLLLTKDSGGVEGFGTQRELACAGALLADLLLAGRVRVNDDKKHTISVVDRSGTGDALLDEGLARFAKRDGKRAADAVQSVAKGLDKTVGGELAARGLVRVEGDGALGFLTRSFPATDPGIEVALRERLRQIVTGAAAPTADEVGTLAVLQGVGSLKHAVSRDEVGLSGRELKARVESLVESNPAGQAVADAMKQLQLLMAAVAAGAAGAAAVS